jgi:hypothetical protein
MGISYNNNTPHGRAGDDWHDCCEGRLPCESSPEHGDEHVVVRRPKHDIILSKMARAINVRALAAKLVERQY